MKCSAAWPLEVRSLCFSAYQGKQKLGTLEFGWSGNWVAGEISDIPGRIDACNRIRYTVFGQTFAGRNEHIDMLQALLVQLADSLKLKRINWSLRVQKTFSKSQTLMIIVQSFRLQRPVNSVANWFSWPCSRQDVAVVCFKAIFVVRLRLSFS